MYTVYMARAAARPSTVLTVRVPVEVERRLTQVARAKRRTRSDMARVILEQALVGAPVVDPAAEARRQSTLASARRSDRETLAFTTAVADRRGWK
jgi:predicted DNA-binding protein